MVAPLVAVALALLSKKLQDNQQKKAFTHQSNMAEQEALAAIDAQRAARAGDSGYMQAAGRSAINFPRAQPSQSGPFLSSVGSALLQQRDAPSTAGSGGGMGGGEAQAPQLRSNDDDEYKQRIDRYY